MVVVVGVMLTEWDAVCDVDAIELGVNEDSLLEGALRFLFADCPGVFGLLLSTGDGELSPLKAFFSFFTGKLGV